MAKMKLMLITVTAPDVYVRGAQGNRYRRKQYFQIKYCIFLS